MPKRLTPSDISQQREELRQYVHSFPPFEDMPDHTIDSTLDTLVNPHDSVSDNRLDTLVNPAPSFNGSTSLTHIEPMPVRRPGQNLTNEQRAAIQAIFLEEFSRRSNLTDAARVAGIDRTLVYYWLQHDSNFADGYAVAEQQANDALRREAWRRATDGVSEPIVSMGKLVRDDDGSPLTVQKYDTPLLMMLMRARMPEYRDTKNLDVNQTTTINTSHVLSIDVRGMSQEELAQLRALAEGVKSREQARIEKTGKADNE